MSNCGLPKGYEDQCCLNRSGWCTLDTAEYSEIDRATEMRGCGFIGVNDRYLLWKYGVPYKDFKCGNCHYFMGDKSGDGECTNPKVEPHTKGVKVNGETVYADSKEYYSGAKACKQFKKREEVREDVSDTVRTPRCPYLGSMGLHEIHCQLHCLHIIDRRFESPKLLQEHTDEYCFLNFDKCETYQQTYKREMESTDKWILNYRECAYCCNNSGYTGLKTHDGSTHGFCQVRQEDVPKFDENTVCEYFNKLYREEVKEVAKRTYYTKCGREFQKNSTAVVTGYTIDVNDPECADCPFQVDVKEGWPPVHKRWECRAGSEPPNHETTWRGSLEDKCTIQIDSLNNQLMEEIKEYCKNHPDLGAGYNADSMADCRRTLSISCSQNKKGIAAKKELIEKFFPVTGATPDERYENEEDESLFDEQKCRICGCTDNMACPGGCYWVEDDLCSACAEKDEETEAMENENACPYGKLNHNECRCIQFGEGVCDTMRRQDWDRYHYVREMQGKVNCDIFDKLAKEIIAEKKPEKLKNVTKPSENDAFLPENVTKASEIVIFDYSTVDGETGAFLQEKANRITEIRIKSTVAIGKELKEAQSRLANHDGGTFIAWSESLGLKKSSIYNHINAYNWVVQNLDNIEDAENIQPSLLFAASKPSAPKELSEKVASGDITTHKQYKELERRLKEAEEAKKNGDEHYRRMLSVADGNRIKAEMELRKFQDENKRNINALSKTVRDLQQQLEQAKRNSDPTKVRELGEIISEKQQEIETLRQQLHDKPIEVPATEVVEKEVIPDEIASVICSKITDLYAGIALLSEKEVSIFIESTNHGEHNDIHTSIDMAINVLNKIDRALYEAASTHEPDGHCGDCVHADMDVVTEEQLDEGKTLCTVTGQVVDIMDGCGKYKFFGAQS